MTIPLAAQPLDDPAETTPAHGGAPSAIHCWIAAPVDPLVGGSSGSLEVVVEPLPPAASVASPVSGLAGL